ncbi:plasmid mobilization relaxosome protein MobC [Paracoccus sp. YIM 132242]|uniref:Plasmid mobilization relaxosome protein MobC n=1 Tax=Paracoccus lichenicola TaxID=2665644 RepID=A0A6L6HTI4_9RHOB|nr:DNA mobilization endonuclease VirD1/MobC family subunit [Paracoccus lichenicola]MTE01689.1 plasmid mobilization relaxosome protein MobC [Paracoccus lichenicola]
MFTKLNRWRLARQKLTPSERTEAVRRLRAGGTVQTVAEAVGASKETISKVRQHEIRSRDSATTDGKPVSARLTPAEIDQLEWLKAHFGLGSNSDAIRALVRAASGMLEFDPVTAEKLNEVRGELRKIGVNVNQIALASNRGRIDLARQEWQAVDELRRAFPRVEGYLRAVVNEQRRRGTRLFQKFIEAGRG